MTHKPKYVAQVGIDILRRAVNIFNNCNEDFNYKFTSIELIKLAEAYMACGWDFTPDTWTEKQVQDCIIKGITPQWEEKNGSYVPVYTESSYW